MTTRERALPHRTYCTHRTLIGSARIALGTSWVGLVGAWRTPWVAWTRRIGMILKAADWPSRVIQASCTPSTTSAITRKRSTKLCSMTSRAAKIALLRVRKSRAQHLNQPRITTIWIIGCLCVLDTGVWAAKAAAAPLPMIKINTVAGISNLWRSDCWRMMTRRSS